MFKYISILKNNTKGIVKTLGTVVFCTAILFMIMCLTSAVMSATDFSYDIMPVVIAAILAITAFFNGFILSRLFKENGLLWGIFAAFTVLGVIIVLSLYYGTFRFSSVLLMKSIITFAPAAIGGIIGVNIN